MEMDMQVLSRKYASTLSWGVGESFGGWSSSLRLPAQEYEACGAHTHTTLKGSSRTQTFQAFPGPGAGAPPGGFSEAFRPENSGVPVGGWFALRRGSFRKDGGGTLFLESL